MDEVAKLPVADLADLFKAAAAKRGFMANILEKDFWVCWTLKRLFTLRDPPAGMIFKGGTSLSKVYRAIERFSEDIDLSFDRTALGFGGDNDPAAKTSRNKQAAALEALTAACQQMIRDRLLSQLQEQFADALGTAPGSTWKLEVDAEADDGQTLLFHYPTLQTATAGGAAYVSPVVRMEFGARGEQWPEERLPVTSYVAEDFPDLVKEGSCLVRVLKGERTFWEKATILHYWHHAPPEKPFPDRQSRHYYDLAKLYRGELGARALADFPLLEAVARHKSVFFFVGWARYDEAKPGSLRLVPPAHRTGSLKADYAKMSEMLFPGMQHPDFEDILSALGDLESRING